MQLILVLLLYFTYIYTCSTLFWRIRALQQSGKQSQHNVCVHRADHQLNRPTPNTHQCFAVGGPSGRVQSVMHTELLIFVCSNCTALCHSQADFMANC